MEWAGDMPIAASRGVCMELEPEEGRAVHGWTQVVPTPGEAVAVAWFEWKRIPITRAAITRFLAYAAVIIALCTTVAYAASAMSPATYAARSEILFPTDAQATSGGQAQAGLHLATDLVTLRSHRILEPVAQRFHLTADALGKRVAVSVVDNSDVIRIQASDQSPATAKAIVAAIVTGYLKQLPDQTLAEQKFLRAQIGSVTKDVVSLTDQLDRIGSPTSSAATALQTELKAALDQRGKLQGQFDTTAVAALVTQHPQLLTAPYLINGQISPKPMQAAIVGLVLGIVLSIGLTALSFRRMLKRLPGADRD